MLIHIGPFTKYNWLENVTR